MENGTNPCTIWYDRKTLLSSVGVDLPCSCEYKEGEIVTADFKGITLRLAYTEASIDRCFFALLKAEDLNRYPVRRFFYKLFHRVPKQTVFDTDNPKDWNKAVRAALDRMPPVKKG
jgi:hypothetical protein